MSGGSYNYIYMQLSEECGGNMYDPEMDELIKDLCKVLHDLEWWQSGDSSESTYRTTLSAFKKKWLNSSERDKRLKGYIDEQMSLVKRQLYNLIGETTEGTNNE